MNQKEINGSCGNLTKITLNELKLEAVFVNRKVKYFRTLKQTNRRIDNKLKRKGKL